ncbi:hypothetical protein [Desmospora profundinema]|uniref:Transcriptional antiterminator Rof (Rho-off) n=1 Tax=Desmospora profundinema TaxID=1571184 RepID=A0ABU1IJV9_9BACL|nr:hypothetical protein [Desmospora profundinema]MDR6224439.1 transcriptional antiterminator Rof (Rho-off) [Desmospora profundinema]
MRIGWILLSMLLCTGLLGCTNDDLAAKPSPTQKESTKEEHSERESRQFLKRVDEQMEREEVVFTLKLQDGTPFKGKETDGKWILISADEEEETIRIEQEDGTIHLTHGEQTETLTTRQFGLVSPRDHMKLVRESVQRVSTETKDGQDWYVADLNKEEMGDKLGRWMGEAYHEGAASQASRKFIFRYRFQFDETELREMVMQIIPLEESDSSETIRYTFKSDK